MPRRDRAIELLGPGPVRTAGDELRAMPFVAPARHIVAGRPRRCCACTAASATTARATAASSRTARTTSTPAARPCGPSSAPARRRSSGRPTRQLRLFGAEPHHSRRRALRAGLHAASSPQFVHRAHPRLPRRATRRTRCVIYHLVSAALICHRRRPPRSAVLLRFARRLLEDLPRWTTAAPPASAGRTQGLLNRGYRLVTTRGTYFLKHHLDGDREAIARQHRATQRLQTLGVPVAPPVEDARRRHGRRDRRPTATPCTPGSTAGTATAPS